MEACMRLNRLALVMIVCVSTIAVAEDMQTGSAVISHLNNNLLAIMKNAKTLGYSERYKVLDKVIGETHDLAKIARFSVGRKNWNEMSDQQQEKFVDEFHRYSIATYVDRFNGFGGEIFKTKSEQPLPRGRVLVKSLLRSPEYGVVNFDYILGQDAAGQWKIINIMADGVSDLALKRAHYTDVIKQKGIDALIAELIAKTASYTAKK
jgi:phospholipid transport system substrate-binding protein